MRKLLGVALLAVACGGVKYGSSTTKGVACADAISAWCEKIITSCGLAPSTELDDCRAGGTRGCCGTAMTCGDPVANPTGAAECVNRIPTDSCSDFTENGVPKLPAYCLQMF